MPLFRTEALRGQDRLHGEVILAPPVSWQLMGSFLLGGVLIAILFLATASYSQVTTVGGRLTGSLGVTRVAAPQAGVVEELLVAEGRQVEAGAPLLRIAGGASDGAATLGARRSDALARRDDILQRRAPELRETLRARIAALDAQIAGERAEIASLAAQLGEQQGLVRSAAAELERARAVAARGFVSQRDVLQREELLATRRQGASRIEQELATRRARIAAGEAERARARADHDLALADLAGARAELAGLAASEGNRSAVVVTAGRRGTVTGITVHPGDSVAAGAPMLTLIPDGTRLQARIEVPAAAAGFVAPGQPVRLAVDAFPYQTYGTIEGRVESISAATVPVLRPDGRSEEVFLVEVSLSADSVEAYGRAQPLRPGMTVTARITTRSRSLAQWLFDPLYAVGRR